MKVTGLSFTTSPLDDGQPPQFILFPDLISATDVKVVIGWETDKPSTSEVLWAGVGRRGRALEPALVRVHRVTLIGLVPGQQYRFRGLSTNGAGRTLSWGASPEALNLAATRVAAKFQPLSQDGSFFTRSEPDARPPVIFAVRAWWSPLPQPW